ncbi:MAG: hypothetical protein A2445_00745 [Candidatus Jacksonbacteria bacterium RIFOXYC2_FULL_44_29]|nr:MAG: Protein translocase subunit SecA [Parcubacteria group bacterium GW2011_GWA2_42_28]KKT55463.1 MAG: Protein translocase subunit SecA [Parcubacteria group bacterium GW2011_GWC2_44_22]OGY75229.1 MAG: hypothetical protein A2240_05840 [Candidatus Jacksonbacteria bacterium RIFOXYA2_FULL_43_12]OGY75932.1 MAG: hypothetical protein A2295_03345 [Candidatus Jacksonbacteria bacterium RIFOXYB2_FULL_44_15]OGY77947.1 MAG: hypothetical protein A2445_00745 [Candidatus Jacksonbacteria bacterium RIFOXYC2_F
MSIFKKIFGDPNKKVLQELNVFVEAVNQLEADFEKKNQDELRALTQQYITEIAELKTLEEKEKYLDKILAPAFAAVRESAKRTLRQRHFDVQILGAATLHQGNIAEMKTGEGKTLVATMAVYLNALLDQGVHVVTVNDYLARRDTSWMGQIYNYLGLKVSCLQNQGNSLLYDETAKKDVASESTEDDENIETLAFKVDQDFLRPCSRVEAYQAHITYGTNSEFGFDYLRDNMVAENKLKVQRGHHYYAIVDEVDSILIDEARTPLIISSPDTKSAEYYKKFAYLIPTLKVGEHYNLDEERHAVTLTEAGIERMESLLNVKNIYTEDVTLAFHLDQALKAYALYKLDRDYVVKDGEIIIVDQFTGRLMPGRRYSQGLHQAIEAKEGVEVKQESKTLATITIQNYFRMYHKLAGMTGTASTEAEEFNKIYNLEVTEIPTNKSIVRKDRPDVIYKSETGKFKALINTIREKYDQGQPVLVGTISIQKNEILSELLKKANIPHQILNAKQHEKEAQIIAQAGKLKAVTVATNMAGRGVDIVLGGNPVDPIEAEQVRKLGGLCVFGSERHEARRIDNQLRGRTGRQGDPGESQFFISLEDDLMRIFGSSRIKSLMDRLGLPDDLPITNRMISSSIEKAQERVEGHNFDIRKHLVEYDDVINKQRTAVYRERSKILDLWEAEEPLRDLILEMVKKEIKKVVEIHTAGSDWNLKEIKEVLQSMPISFDDAIFTDPQISTDKSALSEKLQKLAEEHYQTVTKDLDPEMIKQVERALLLRTIDNLWINHLDAIEHLRVGIGLRGYGQQDPLTEYKREAFAMYQALLEETDKQVVYNIYKIFISYQMQKQAAEKLSPVIKNVANAFQGARLQHETTNAFSASGMTRTEQPTKLNKADPYAGGRHQDQAADHYIPKDRDPESGQKVGRNDLCICGSGKKYKRCCGA